MSTDAPFDVVFDLDGTLVDSVAHCTTIMNAMLTDRNSARRIGEDEARPHITLGGLKMIQALLAEDCGDPDLEIADFRARYAAMPTPDCLFPGVREGLDDLAAAGFRLSVCSNKTQPLCDKVVADLGLAPLFAAVVGSTPDLPLKPHRALLDKTLALTGGRVERCCYVGDSAVDEDLARACGVPLVFLTYGYAEAGFACETPFVANAFTQAAGQIRNAMNDLWPSSKG